MLTTCCLVIDSHSSIFLLQRFVKMLFPNLSLPHPSLSPRATLLTKSLRRRAFRVASSRAISLLLAQVSPEMLSSTQFTLLQLLSCCSSPAPRKRREHRAYTCSSLHCRLIFPSTRQLKSRAQVLCPFVNERNAIPTAMRT